MFIDSAERIIIEYHQHLYANKLNKLEIDKFLEIQKVSRLNQEKIENLNRPVPCKGLTQ